MISVHELIGALATAGDMASLLGKLGARHGRKQSASALRADGAKGGRPPELTA